MITAAAIEPKPTQTLIHAGRRPFLARSSSRASARRSNSAFAPACVLDHAWNDPMSRCRDSSDSLLKSGSLIFDLLCIKMVMPLISPAFSQLRNRISLSVSRPGFDHFFHVEHRDVRGQRDKRPNVAAIHLTISNGDRFFMFIVKREDLISASAHKFRIIPSPTKRKPKNHSQSSMAVSRQYQGVSITAMIPAENRFGITVSYPPKGGYMIPLIPTSSGCSALWYLPTMRPKQQ